MNICLDASAAVHGRAGLGRYAQELAAALLQVDPQDRFAAFYNDAARAQPVAPFDRLPSITSRSGNKAWRMSVLLAHYFHFSQDRSFPGVDVFHAADHLLPRFSRVRSVFTLNDLTYRLVPQAHQGWNRRFLSLMMGRFLQAADVVIAISESTRQDAARLYNIDPARIEVVYDGVSPRFHPAAQEDREAVRQKYGLPGHFILYVGMIEPRKNLVTLLRAYRKLRDEKLEQRLVIAGKRGWLAEGFFRALAGLDLENDVLLPGFIAEQDLPALYSAADVFAYPSLYEGFGLPVLEAMACGAPVVCSNSSSLPELAGEAALMVDPADAAGLAQALAQAATDRALRLRMKARGLEQARPFTWERTARLTVEAYRRAAGK
ncbi:MAG TPA: glycosyltransferase family 1 protein [Anaerolineales bacterium]